jgi:hypothetical protein
MATPFPRHYSLVEQPAVMILNGFVYLVLFVSRWSSVFFFLAAGGAMETEKHRFMITI